MSEDIKIVIANFTPINGVTPKSVMTEKLWQYDRGRILKFVGLDLPFSYEVHFSNQAMSGSAYKQVTTGDSVEIPYNLLQTGMFVYAWIYLQTGEESGQTVYMITMPVLVKPKPDDETPTPPEQSVIDELIGALNEGVESAQAAAEMLANPQVEVEQLAPGSQPSGSYKDGTFRFRLPVNPGVEVYVRDGTLFINTIS